VRRDTCGVITLPSYSLAWIWLTASIAAESIGNMALKHSQGFSLWLPTLTAGGCFMLAIWLMSLSMKQLGMGLSYAVWAGSGTALTVLIGVLHYGEPLPSLRLVGLLLVVAGVVVLNLSARAV